MCLAAWGKHLERCIPPPHKGGWAPHKARNTACGRGAQEGHLYVCEHSSGPPYRILELGGSMCMYMIMAMTDAGGFTTFNTSPVANWWAEVEGQTTGSAAHCGRRATLVTFVWRAHGRLLGDPIVPILSTSTP